MGLATTVITLALLSGCCATLKPTWADAATSTLMCLAVRGQLGEN